MKQILHIVGARPQFIKLAPLYKVLVSSYKQTIIHTGQHFDKEMSDFLFRDLNLPQPDYNLKINKGLHGEQTGKMIIEIEKIINIIKPNLVIVYGDTNSTLAGALSAVKLNVLTIHIEAGLRSFNTLMPEEINRIVADHICDYLFAPTKTAMNNLKNEYLEKKSFFVGDIMVDTLEYGKKIIKSMKIIKSEEYYLLTLHRPYNVDSPNNLKEIIKEISKIKSTIIFPVHPRTRNVLQNIRIKINDNIKIINPLGYIDFLSLMINSQKILTDSGGIQKEAYILKKPCITLRSETEWIETVAEGWNLLINPKSNKNYSQIIYDFTPPQTYRKIFGTDVAKKIKFKIDNILNKR